MEGGRLHRPCRFALAPSLVSRTNSGMESRWSATFASWKGTGIGLPSISNRLLRWAASPDLRHRGTKGKNHRGLREEQETLAEIAKGRGEARLLWNPVLLVISDQWLVVSEICLLVFGFCLPIPNWRRRRPPLCPCASVPLCHLALARSACAARHWALECNAFGVECGCLEVTRP